MIEGLCEIQSVPITKSVGGIDVEDGVFECAIAIDTEEMAATGDPKGYCDMKVAQAVAACRRKSGLPLGESLWSVRFTDWAQRNLNYPEGFII